MVMDDHKDEILSKSENDQNRPKTHLENTQAHSECPSSAVANDGGRRHASQLSLATDPAKDGTFGQKQAKKV